MNDSNIMKELTSNFTSISQIPVATIDELWIKNQFSYQLNGMYHDCFKEQITAMLEKLAFYHLIWSNSQLSIHEVNLRKIWSLYAADAAKCNRSASKFLQSQQALVMKFRGLFNPHYSNHEQLKSIRRLFQNALSKFKMSPSSYFQFIQNEEEKRSKDILLMEAYLYKREFVSEQVHKDLEKLALYYLTNGDPESVHKHRVLQKNRSLIATQIVTEEIENNTIYSKTDQAYFWQLYQENNNN